MSRGPRRAAATLIFITAVGTTSAARAQDTPPDITGIWQMTIGKSLTLPPIQMTQDGANILAQFTPIDNLTPAFTATIGSTQSFLVKWNTTRKDIPGINGLAYWGTIVAPNMIRGGYGASPSQSVGTWTAIRVAALGPAIMGLRNAASGALGAISPGELISIYANADTNPIGPKAAAGLQLDPAGKVASSLNDVRVHFLPIDVYSPLTFVSAGQVNAVVPYEVGGLSSVNMQIAYAHHVSAPVSLQVAPTAPGIFTTDGSGVGPGAILNDDGITLNGPAHPEPRGGYITLFVTGEGQTTPPGISGKVTELSATTPLTPMPLFPPEIRINGQPCVISFAGEAPGLVSGVLQINVQIPSSVSSGNVPDPSRDRWAKQPRRRNGNSSVTCIVAALLPWSRGSGNASMQHVSTTPIGAHYLQSVSNSQSLHGPELFFQIIG